MARRQYGARRYPRSARVNEVVREVVASVSAMPQYHDRVIVETPKGKIDDRIKGRSDEIKQVVLLSPDELETTVHARMRTTDIGGFFIGCQDES